MGPEPANALVEKTVARLILALTLLGLVACATRQEPVIVSEPELEPAPSAPAPVVKPDAAQTSVVAYSRSATEAFQQADYRLAISLAERGLRSNRYAADLYLILAQAYDALGNRDQARNFARLGLRYTGDDESLKAPLQELAQP